MTFDDWIAEISDEDKETLCLHDAWTAARQWIPVEEALPEPGQRVLAHTDGTARWGPRYKSEFHLAWYAPESKTWSFKGFSSLGYVVTHWMPIPELPEKE